MIEVASTGRAKCRGCKKAIAAGELRFGDEVPGNFDGMMTFWYHLPCGVVHRPALVRAALAKYKKPFPNRAAIEASLEPALADAETRRIQRVERAPTGRATCQHCDVAIEKATLRVAILRDATMPMLGNAYLHVSCASAFVRADVDALVTGKAGKRDRAEVTAILRAVKLLADARGKALERGVHEAKKPVAEIVVLGDWLEDQGCALSKLELDQLLSARRKLAKKPAKPAKR